MKKILALMLTAMFALTGIAAFTGVNNATATEDAPEVYEVSGVIAEITDAYILLEDADSQQFQANLSEDTHMELAEDDVLAVGDAITVTYNGMMTRSLPPQIAALSIARAALPEVYEVSGVVTEITEEYVMVEDTDGQQLQINLFEDTQMDFDAEHVLTVGESITVTYNGMMTRSLPAQIAALSIRPAALPEIYDVSGMVTEITEEYVMIEDADGQQLQVNLSEDTLVEYSVSGSEELSVGDYITVLYNGMMTRSLPAQMTALTIRATALTGTVTAVEESRFTMLTDEGMEVIVNGTTADWPVVAEDARIRVYFNGVMTLSLPGQIGAQLIMAAE
ncbi:MAG: hypothetical protein ACI4MJ_08745 [Aristaeellaceae bacterium]